MITVFAWIFFRAENISHTWQYSTTIFSVSLFQPIDIFPKQEIILILFFLFIEWIGRKGQYGIQTIFLKQKTILKYAFYYAIILAIIWFRGKEQVFIYFQF